ncbi:MAG: hypothetical protein GX444_21115 [Myxococcales bacterium]|nr:hypothetical protein [Myxococcales bacterium]
MRKQILPFSLGPEPAAASAAWLRLQPVSVRFDDVRRRVDWRQEGAEWIADLPFGVLRLRPQAMEGVGPTWHLETILEIRRAVRLHDLEIRYETRGGPADKAWVPYLRPGEKFVMADQVWRTPAVIAGAGSRAIALVADVAMWPVYGRLYLNFLRRNEDGNSVFSFGLGAWRTQGHIFFEKSRADSAIPRDTIIRTSHYLLERPLHGELPLAEVASFAWDRFSRKAGCEPQMLPFAAAGDLVVGRIFREDLYREFHHEGRPVAGMITQTVTAGSAPAVMGEKEFRSYLKHQGGMIKLMGMVQTSLFLHPLGYRLLTGFLHAGRLKVLPIVSFQCWFNQARTALGAALHAGRSGDTVLRGRARRIVELALAAPLDEGCPPSICLIPDGKVSWRRGTRAFEMIDAYHLPDAAVTAFHLLEWHEWIAPDPRILARSARLAEFLLTHQQTDGSVPAWMEAGPHGLQAQEILARSASTAAPAMFWARLHRLAPDDRWLAAAKASLSFVEREVLPEEKWFDFELLYSCAGRPTGQDGPEPFTGCFPVNSLSMYWAACAALDVYLATEDEKWLSLAERLTGRLSQFQQVFDHPRLSIDTFGGFAVMNADAEFNDARQGLFVPLYFDLYRATRRPEMLERALAALRASFTTMLAEEMQPVAPGNLIHLRPRDRGAILENYGHTGRDEMTAGYLSPDWGCGTALYAAGMTYRQFGQVYVDLERERVWALDRCAAALVSFADGRLRLTIESAERAGWRIAVDDPGHRLRELIVNDRPARPVPGIPGQFDAGEQVADRRDCR